MFRGESGAVLSSEGEEGAPQGPRFQNRTRCSSISISITFSSEEFLTAGKVRCDSRSRGLGGAAAQRTQAGAASRPP